MFDKIRGNVIKIVAKIVDRNARIFEMNVLRSSNKEEYTQIAFFRGRGYRGRSLITIDSFCSSLLPDVASRTPERAPFFLDSNEDLKLRVFIDRSVF